ncbi:GNAT family N-acetyltransferase [Patescibacteria group bacterium]|nr:GNAT family N-acetyltransferase [Patescibacteria group bacterium]MBU1895734.1 GNAT family N-acetyltransferase [Patescibacteria group bacterium]
MIELIPATSTQFVDFLYGCYTTRSIQGDFQRVKTIEQELFREKIRVQNNKGNHTFIVVKGDSPVGYAYSNKSPCFNHYEIGVTLVPEERHKGLGIITHRLLVKQALVQLHAKRLIAYVSTRNIAERKVLEKLAFQCEGIMRQAGTTGDIVHDIAIYGALHYELEAGL